MTFFKRALVIHGYQSWHRTIKRSHPLYHYFKSRGYRAISPYLFKPENRFNLNSSLRGLKKNLSNKKPSVIVAISLGSLILPYLTKLFPKAKLIFIGGGVNFSPKSKLLKFLFRVADRINLLFLIKISSLPSVVLRLIYQVVNPPPKDEKQLGSYYHDLEVNLNCLKEISPKKQQEILHFLITADTNAVLSGIKNKALIFSGKNDQLMPVEQGERLKKYLKNSKLVITDGGHFSSFSKANYSDLDRFLKEKG